MSQLFGRPHAGGEGAGSRLASGLADLLLYGEHGVPGRVEQHAGEKGYAGHVLAISHSVEHRRLDSASWVGS